MFCFVLSRITGQPLFLFYFLHFRFRFIAGWFNNHKFPYFYAVSAKAKDGGIRDAHEDKPYNQRCPRPRR